jgi:pyrroline-5-carboxylate reductase
MLAALGLIGAQGPLDGLVGQGSPPSASGDLILAVVPAPTIPGSTGVDDPVFVGSVPEVARNSDVILVATRSVDIIDTLERLSPSLEEHHVVVVSTPESTLGDLRLALGPGPALLRVILDPDGSAAGVIVASIEEGTAPEAFERAAQALVCLGALELVSEDSLVAARVVVDASRACLAAALAGLEDGATKTGLPGDVARSFVRQTALATAHLLQGHPGSPADLKDQVASPGGTTIAGLAVLEDLGVRGAFIRAVEAGVLKARKM